MFRALVVGLIVASPALAESREEYQLRKTLESLQGNWGVKQMFVAGKPGPVGGRFQFRDDVLVKSTEPEESARMLFDLSGPVPKVEYTDRHGITMIGLMGRTSTGNVVIYKKKALPQILKTLREGRVVAVMLDQNVQASDGIFVQFFGRVACTTTVAAALAIKTGCPIVPAHCVRRADGRYLMAYGPVVDWPVSGRRDEDVAALTQHLTSVIEGWVRDNPEQWLWLHRRWKTRPSLETSSAPAPDGSAVSSESPSATVQASPEERR